MFLKEPFIKLCHSAELPAEFSCGFGDPSQGSCQVNLISCYDSKPTLPLRSECLQFLYYIKSFSFLSEILSNFLESLFFIDYSWGLANESCLFLKHFFEWVNVEG